MRTLFYHNLHSFECLLAVKFTSWSPRAERGFHCFCVRFDTSVIGNNDCTIRTLTIIFPQDFPKLSRWESVMWLWVHGKSEPQPVCCCVCGMRCDKSLSSRAERKRKKERRANKIKSWKQTRVLFCMTSLCHKDNWASSPWLLSFSFKETVAACVCAVMHARLMPLCRVPLTGCFTHSCKTDFCS